MKNLLIFVFLLFFWGCSKENDIDNDLLFSITDSNYPSSYEKLSEEENEEYQSEFEEGTVTFSLIDSFGFVGWSYDDNYEIRKSLYETQFSDAAPLLKMIKQYLLDKSKFTGIVDTLLLSNAEVKISFQNYGGYYSRSDSTKYNHIGVDFGRQTIDGIEIHNSLLTVSATANGVHRIFGHWYPDVYIPETDQVSVELAQSVLIDRKLIGYNGWGQELSHTIVEEDLTDYQKIIYPYINGDKLELRVCWEFTPSHWQIFMDTSTGEILLEQDVAFYLF